MQYVMNIGFLAGSLTVGAIFLTMAIAGLRKDKVCYEPNCPPIEFKAKPIHFVLWCAFLLAADRGRLRRFTSGLPANLLERYASAVCRPPA